MNDHDRRQLESMNRQIGAFRAGVIDLPGLISSLESLRHALQMVPQAWVDQFWSKWGILEEIYSLSIVREQPLSKANREEVRRVLDDIEAMVCGLLPAVEPDE